MTIDDRFERIEHVTAGIVEQAKKDREEARRLWRDTQHQLERLTTDVDRLTLSVAELAGKMGDLTATMDDRDRIYSQRDAQLGERVDALVSAIGELKSKRSP